MREPQEIWEDGIEEGERRLERLPAGLAATGFAGGIDVLVGIVAVAVTASAAHAVLPEETAHVLASLVFGLGFVFITIGRAELFTENFLIPVGAVHAGRSTVSRLLRMWGITLVANFVGLAGFAALFAVHGVLPAPALDAAGTMADTLGERSVLAAFMSAVAAGTVMTLFTWVVAAADTGIARIAAALIVGFVLSALALNHAVVGFGEMILGLFAGTATVGWGDLVRTIAIAIAGNLVGGVGLVFATRLAQVRGEPGSESGRRAAPAAVSD
jgi:formate/nitrite transporter FocA (FNT family)